jgi:hypothetical protein
VYVRYSYGHWNRSHPILSFHYDTAAGGGVVQPCEAAYLSSIDPIRGGDAVPPQVTVLVVCVPISQHTNLVLMEGQAEQRP